jgi:hypothetical protein
MTDEQDRHCAHVQNPFRLTSRAYPLPAIAAEAARFRSSGAIAHHARIAAPDDRSCGTGLDLRSHLRRCLGYNDEDKQRGPTAALGNHTRRNPNGPFDAIEG